MLEPFTSRRYAIGIIPNKGYVLWPVAAVIGVLLLVYRDGRSRLRLVRMFWAITGVYVCFQIAHSIAKLAQDRRAKDLLLFAPFVAVQDLGDSIRIFDPRFPGRVGLLEVILPKTT